MYPVPRTRACLQLPHHALEACHRPSYHVTVMPSTLAARSSKLLAGIRSFELCASNVAPDIELEPWVLWSSNAYYFKSGINFFFNYYREKKWKNPHFLYLTFHLGGGVAPGGTQLLWRCRLPMATPLVGGHLSSPTCWRLFRIQRSVVHISWMLYCNYRPITHIIQVCHRCVPLVMSLLVPCTGWLQVLNLRSTETLYSH